MEKIMMIAPDKCTGCRTCEIICSFRKAGEFNPQKAAVTVLAFEEAAITIPMMCTHCDNPACMRVCTTGAIYKSENAVLVNSQKCVGCKLCVSACPFGNISYSNKTGKITKCDLCDGAPQCAEFCPSGAISYKEAGRGQLNKRKFIADKFKNLFGEVNE